MIPMERIVYFIWRISQNDPLKIYLPTENWEKFEIVQFSNIILHGIGFASSFPITPALLRSKNISGDGELSGHYDTTLSNSEILNEMEGYEEYVSPRKLRN